MNADQTGIVSQSQAQIRPGVPSPPLQIIIVENQAHVASGHFPVLCSELAHALHHEGVEVTLLTARGWLSNDENEEPPFTIRQLSRLSYSLYLRGKLLNRLPPRKERWASTAWRDAVMGLFARRVARQLGGADIIMTSLSSDPLVWTLISGHGRLLVYQFWSPKNSQSKLLLFVSRRVEARRQRKGGRTRIVVNYDGARQHHAEATPWLDPVLLPFIASCVVEPIPDARAKLGLVSGRRLALMFGVVHAGKNPEVVWRAFQTLPEWQLIIAGAGAADAYRSWRGNQAEPAIEPVLIDGFASEEVRQLLHSAVDLVVLSFQAGWEQDSGTLVDAISYSLPVVCSDQCASGRLAERLSIGSNFVSGDAQSLAEVVRNVPTALDPATIEHARDETSSSRMARMHLAALGRQPSADAKP